MPLQLFLCDKCKTEFEKIIRKYGDLPACPSCGGSDVTAVICASTFHLKGYGWARDLYGGSKK